MKKGNQNTNYQNMLAAELQLRISKKAKYSLRAFARDLNVAPGFLSQIIHSKKRLSEAKASELVELLSWSPAKKKTFITLVKIQFAKGFQTKSRLKADLDQFHAEVDPQEIAEADYEAIGSSWITMALYELIRLEDFQENPAWIAMKLGISRAEAKKSFDILVKARVVHKVDGIWEKKYGHWVSSAPKVKKQQIIQRSIRMRQKFLEKAIPALETQSREERNFTLSVLSINPEKIPLANEIIRDFRMRLSTLLDGPPHGAVYALGVQLFRVDKKSR